MERLPRARKLVRSCAIVKVAQEEWCLPLRLAPRTHLEWKSSVRTSSMKRVYTKKLKNISSLVLEQRADAGCVRHGKRIAMSEASVYGHLAASHLLGGHTGSLISTQAKDALLILRELGRVYPVHVVTRWKPDDDFVPFDLRTLEDGLDFDDGFVPVRVVFGDALRNA